VGSAMTARSVEGQDVPAAGCHVQMMLTSAQGRTSLIVGQTVWVKRDSIHTHNLSWPLQQHILLTTKTVTHHPVRVLETLSQQD
jgi:hypothetical protein